MRILLLEDEYSLRLSIKEYLVACGFEVEEARNGEEAENTIYAKAYDILLFDVKVPIKNGFEVAKEIRQNGINTPIVFITSLTEIDQVEEGYKVGCCDYIRKPFELKELVLRITQVLKMAHFHTQNDILELPFGYSFDLKRFTLQKDGSKIMLTKKESAIISLLVENIGNTVAVDDFMFYVWGEDIDPTNVRVQINNLRKKLGDELIVNARGFGYRIDKKQQSHLK